MRLDLFPGRFDLDLTVRSHGWYDLEPFRYDREGRSLSFTALERGLPVAFAVEERPEGLRVESSRRIARAAAERLVRRVLDLEAGLAEFHQACSTRSDQGFGWIAERGAGRILRSPSLFEDAVKVLATTNCSWALTRAVVRNLVEVFGRGGAFPDAAFVAGLGEGRLRSELRLGYRAPFLATFAERVATGVLDLSRWEEAGRSDEEVDLEIRAQPGFGPYAAQTLGRLLGRHARLGLDSWSRKKVAELRFRGRAVPDRRVERLYAPFGRWAGLAFWLDVTRDWHEEREDLWP